MNDEGAEEELRSKKQGARSKNLEPGIHHSQFTIHNSQFIIHHS
jgi:hypothetical protein